MMPLESCSRAAYPMAACIVMVYLHSISPRNTRRCKHAVAMMVMMMKLVMLLVMMVLMI